jgi:hypothetical protein
VDAAVLAPERRRVEMKGRSASGLLVAMLMAVLVPSVASAGTTPRDGGPQFSTVVSCTLTSGDVFEPAAIIGSAGWSQQQAEGQFEQMASAFGYQCVGGTKQVTVTRTG